LEEWVTLCQLVCPIRTREVNNIPKIP